MKHVDDVSVDPTEDHVGTWLTFWYSPDKANRG